MKVALVLHSKVFLNREGRLYEYVFGNPSYKGVFRDYADSGNRIDFFEEDIFKAGFETLARAYDHFDFQFAIDIPSALVESLLAAGKTIAGGCPPYAASKQYQALVLSKNKKTSGILPQQILISSADEFRAINAQKLISWFKSEYLIVKSFYSSRSTMYGGFDYHIFHKRSWPVFADYVLKQEGWFSPLNGIVVSELITTSGDGNGIVYKFHIPTGFSKSTNAIWPLKCAKMLGEYHLDKIGNDIKAMADVFELKGWAYGDMEPCRQTAIGLMEAFFPLPCLFSVDTMISSEGRIYVLELNKMAATFLEPFGRNAKVVLREYMDNILSCATGLKPSLEGYMDYKIKNDVIEGAEDGVWISA